jgi:hypothetical protein
MDENLGFSTFSGTVATPKCGLVTFAQIVSISDAVKTRLTRSAHPQDIVLRLKVLKGGASHAYKSMADFERNYSAFDAFSQFEMTAEPRYEHATGGVIARFTVRRTHTLCVDVDVAGDDAAAVTACAEEFLHWLEDFMNAGAPTAAAIPLTTVIPDIPLYRSVLPAEDAHPPADADSLGALPEDREEKRQKSFLKRNLVEIIFVILGLIGVYLLVTSWFR